MFKSIRNNQQNMTKSEQTSEKQSKGNFSVIEQSVNKYFVDIEHSVPRFQQELFDLQNEFYKAWKNAVNANLALQKEFANKTGFLDIPEAGQKIIESMNEEIAKARLMRDNISIATIETMKKNIKMWNDSADVFADLNKKILQYWIPIFASNHQS